MMNSDRLRYPSPPRESIITKDKLLQRGPPGAPKKKQRPQQTASSCPPQQIAPFRIPVEDDDRDVVQSEPIGRRVLFQ